MKKIITIISIIIISFLFGLNFVKPIECSKDDCNHYVYYKNEKLCIPQEVKGYIEQLQTKGEDRMKSKRGIFPKNN